MSKKCTSAVDRLYLAVTDSRDTKPFRKCGGLIEKRIKDSLRGIGIPRRKREDYLLAVTLISSKLLSGKARLFSRLKALCLDDQKAFDMTFGGSDLRTLRGILEACQRSSREVEYASFIGHSGLSIRSFIDTIGVYAEGRKICFQEIPGEKRKAREEILQFVKDSEEGSKEALQKIIRILEEHLSHEEDGYWPSKAYSIAAALTMRIKEANGLLEQNHPLIHKDLKSVNSQSEFSDILFSDENGDTTLSRVVALYYLAELGVYTHRETGELIPFDEFFVAGCLRGYVDRDKEFLRKRKLLGVVLGNDMVIGSKRVVQHKLQHSFDNLICIRDITVPGSDQELRDFLLEENRIEKEYRAFLAELVFSEHRMEIYRHIEEYVFLAKVFGIDSAGRDIQIWALDKIRRALDRNMDEKQVIEAARKLLNDAYKVLCGLTYDQIIEPFRRSNG